MSEIAIVGADLVLCDRVLLDTPITIRDERIQAIGEPPGKTAEVIAAKGSLVLPGLIDLHYHGRLIDLTPEKIPRLLAEDCQDLAKNGVTRFLPTLASAPLAAWLAALPLLADLIKTPPAGAVPLGVHLEGVFMNPGAAGAQPLPFLVPFDSANPDHLALFAKWGGLVKMITFAPEIPGNEKIIELAKARGMVMALGHSNASPAEVRRFAALGVTHVTHLMSGMKGLFHRDPGPPLPALLDDKISVDLICDGYHIVPSFFGLIHRLKPRDKRLLITDAALIALPGALAGQGDEPNRLPNGGLAGSRLRLNRAVKNYAAFTGCPLPEATAMASLNPAVLLGRDYELGSLEPGKLADLWIADRGLEPRAVFQGGRRII